MNYVSIKTIDELLLRTREYAQRSEGKLDQPKMLANDQFEGIETRLCLIPQLLDLVRGCATNLIGQWLTIPERGYRQNLYFEKLCKTAEILSLLDRDDSDLENLLARTKSLSAVLVGLETIDPVANLEGLAKLFEGFFEIAARANEMLSDCRSELIEGEEALRLATAVLSNLGFFLESSLLPRTTYGWKLHRVLCLEVRNRLLPGLRNESSEEWPHDGPKLAMEAFDLIIEALESENWLDTSLNIDFARAEIRKARQLKLGY